MAPLAQTLQQALAAMQRADYKAAERGLRHVLRKEPRHAGALNLLAALLTATKRYEEADQYYQTVLRVDPRSEATLYNYGILLKALGRSDEAIERFSQALALNPGNADSWNNRGAAYNDVRDHARALGDFEKALTLAPAGSPSHLAALYNSGRAFAELKQNDRALAAYRAALSGNPAMAEAWYALGLLQGQMKEHAAAAESLARACQINPDLPWLKGSLLHQRMLICDWNRFDALVVEIEADLRAGRPSADPFAWQGISGSSESLQICARMYNRQRAPMVLTRSFESSPGARLRIGYVSGEFREQATAHLLVGVLEAHDRERFEIVAFDNGWDDGSAIRRRIEAAVHRLVPIREVADAEAAGIIRSAGIDLLVNLNGYFGEERTRLFARRPAPVLVNYLGFPGTLGAPYMDYIIADADVIPAEQLAFFDEKVVTLPDSYQPNDRARPIAARPTRADCGLPENAVVFCCFNNSYKITPAIFAAWMRILSSVPNSVLWLIADNATAAGHLRTRAREAGISPDRIVMAGRQAPAEHLARHACADLFLDTLPYNAHTTASDALWAGLPVLTCRGDAFAGRVGTSLLRAVGLTDLITTSLADYEKLAIRIGTDRSLQTDLRQRLAVNRLSTPLFDTARYTRALENAFETMIARHRAGQRPAAFPVTLATPTS